MLTVQKLKSIKVIKAQRIDTTFKPAEQIINDFKTDAAAKGYTIYLDDKRDNYYDFRLEKAGQTNFKYHIAGFTDKDTFIKDVLQNIKTAGYNVLSHAIYNDWLIVTIDKEIKTITIRTPAKILKMVLIGTLHFRSKDFYFEFTDEEDKTHKFYSDTPLKASEIKENCIYRNNLIYQLDV